MSEAEPSALPNPVSPIPNPVSPIPNPQSAILNPQNSQPEYGRTAVRPNNPQPVASEAEPSATCGERSRTIRYPQPVVSEVEPTTKPAIRRAPTRFLHLSIVSLLFTVFLIATACNPFAPALEEGDPFGDLLGDPATISGFFTNFKNAYELRDISLYEPLLDSSFIFVYYDFDALVEKEWGFAQELESTRRLFQNASLINLRWNQILSQKVTNVGLQARVVRSFNLVITLEGGDAFRGDGNVNFLLDRADSTDVWQLLQWRDESEF